MAFSTYHDATSSNNFGTTVSFDYPSTVNTNDLLIVMAFCDQAQTWSNLTGTFTHLDSGFNTRGWFVGYKYATGSESGTFTIGDAGGQQIATVLRYSGTENPSTQAPEVNTVVSGTSASPNSGSSGTPTGGSKEYTFISWFGGDSLVTFSVSSYPSNYTNTGFDFRAGYSATLGYAMRNLEQSTAEDPGAYTLSESAVDWESGTIIIHPAAAATGDNTIIIVPTGPPLS